MTTRREANAGILAAAALAAVPAVVQDSKLIALRGRHAPHVRPEAKEVHARVLGQAAIAADPVGPAVGRVRHQSSQRRPHDTVLAAHHGHRHLCRPDRPVSIYDPKAHALVPCLPADIRALTGLQDFVATAPLNLVYVAHGERMTDSTPKQRRLFASVDTGFLGQNVYLFCASEGLAPVFRSAVNYAKLHRALNLPDQQFVTFAETVGYPKPRLGPILRGRRRHGAGHDRHCVRHGKIFRVDHRDTPA